MTSQILWALLCTFIIVPLHCAYAYRLILALRRYGKYTLLSRRLQERLQLYIFVEAVLMLLLLHTLDAAVWALLYYLHPAGLPDFATALYFSLASYTTIGYGDVVLSSSLRLVGGMEGVVGTLMFGLSVGLMAAIIHHSTVYRRLKEPE